MEKDSLLAKIDLAKVRANIAGWEDVTSSKDIDVQEYVVCLTNKLYGLTNKQLPEEDNGRPPENKKIIYRVFGKMQVPLLDRPFENEIMAKLAAAGLAPRVYYSDDTVRMEEFIYGRDISAEDKAKPELYLQVCNIMARFHTLFRNDAAVRSKHKKWLFRRVIDERFLVDYIESLDKFKNRALETKTREFVKKYITHGELGFLSKSLGLVSQDPHNDVICHNDIHWGNILYVESTKNYFVIDYEYSNSNPRATDIANFFNEHCFTYGEPTEPYFTFSIERFPKESFIYEFCLYYVFFTHCPREPFKDISSKSFDEFLLFLKNKNLYEALDVEARNLVKEIYILGMFINYFWILVFILTYNENEFQISPEPYIDARIQCYEFFKGKVVSMYGTAVHHSTTAEKLTASPTL